MMSAFSGGRGKRGGGRRGREREEEGEEEERDEGGSIRRWRGGSWPAGRKVT